MKRRVRIVKSQWCTCALWIPNHEDLPDNIRACPYCGKILDKDTEIEKGNVRP